jgi:hypothetical protein
MRGDEKYRNWVFASGKDQIYNNAMYWMKTGTPGEFNGMN